MLMSGLRLSDLNKETTYLLTYLQSAVFAYLFLRIKTSFASRLRHDVVCVL